MSTVQAGHVIYGKLPLGSDHPHKCNAIATDAKLKLSTPQEIKFGDCLNLLAELKQQPSYWTYHITKATGPNYVTLKSSGSCSVGVVSDLEQPDTRQMK